MRGECNRYVQRWGCRYNRCRGGTVTGKCNRYRQKWARQYNRYGKVQGQARATGVGAGHLGYQEDGAHVGGCGNLTLVCIDNGGFKAQYRRLPQALTLPIPARHHL